MFSGVGCLNSAICDNIKDKEDLRKEKIVRIALTYVGTYEKGHNSGVVIDALILKMKYPKGSLYCGIFLGAIFEDGGVKLKFPVGLARNWHQFSRAKLVAIGNIKVSQYTPKPGDVACFKFNSNQINHVEIVYEWPQYGMYFYTIGANTTDPDDPAPYRFKRQGIFIKKRKKSECHIVKIL